LRHDAALESILRNRFRQNLRMMAKIIWSN
jgi:hypothetical protein